MAKTPKRPRDLNELAKRIGDIATGQAADDLPSLPSPTKERAAKGGNARAEKLSRRKRLAIARQGGKASAAARKRR